MIERQERLRKEESKPFGSFICRFNDFIHLLSQTAAAVSAL
jgi:hypothetical protein